MNPPLTGIRVLDFTHVFAGPFCTRCLADLGAEVLHIESRARQMPSSPDIIRNRRGAEERPAYAHRNKLSATIDLKTAEGREVATRLATKADVLVENFSSGVMGRLHLDYERLHPLNPRLVYVSMSGYGHSGPRRDWTSMNMNLQGISGLMLLTGDEGDPPTAISNSWNDYIGGLHGSIEVLQALADRVDSGVGRYVDLAQFEASMGTLGPLLLSSIVNREAPPRMGNRSTSCAPQGVYQCQGEDEWCAIVVQSDEEWRSLGHAMGAPPWAADPRFDSELGRHRHHDEIDAHITAWTSQHSSLEAEQALRAAGVFADRMRRADAIIGADDAGKGYSWLETAYGRPTVAARLPYISADGPLVQPDVVPEFGSDTHAALQRWLGMTESELDALEVAGALS